TGSALVVNSDDYVPENLARTGFFWIHINSPMISEISIRKGHGVDQAVYFYSQMQ
ncbi:hypothetical protein D5086_004436, partial [Populus alba]